MALSAAKIMLTLTRSSSTPLERANASVRLAQREWQYCVAQALEKTVTHRPNSAGTLEKAWANAAEAAEQLVRKEAKHGKSAEHGFSTDYLKQRLRKYSPEQLSQLDNQLTSLIDRPSTSHNRMVRNVLRRTHDLVLAHRRHFENVQAAPHNPLRRALVNITEARRRGQSPDEAVFAAGLGLTAVASSGHRLGREAATMASELIIPVMISHRGRTWPQDVYLALAAG